MSSSVRAVSPQQELGSGFFVALILHGAIAAFLLGLTNLRPVHTAPWGEKAASVGAIQASMVSALPLPPKAQPTEKAVLAEEHVTKAPAPTPKERSEPLPRPNDVLVKSKVEPKTPARPAPRVSQDPPKHPQPSLETPKASSGAPATQILQSATPVKNGTAIASVQDRAFGQRYAWYVATVGRTVAQNWYTFEADARSSQGKRVTLLFDIDHDGIPQNIRVETGSGSPSLDMSAKRALQRVEGFGPLPVGNQITVEYSFDYRQP